MRGNNTRNDAQRALDMEYLVKLMREYPELNQIDWHELLMAHVEEREGDNAYIVSSTQTHKDIKKIKTGYQRVGLNIQVETENTNNRLEELIEISSFELSRRLENRIVQTKKIRELKYADINGLLSPAQLEVLKTIDLEVHIEEINERVIPGGSDITELILAIDKLLKSKRELYGLDAPKKVDKRVAKLNVFDNVSQQGLIDVFDALKIPTGPLKKYLQQTFKGIEIDKTSLNGEEHKNGSDV